MAVVIAVLVSMLELMIADRKHGVFTGGFGQSNSVDTLAESVLFLGGYAASQAALALLVWIICVRLNRDGPGWKAVYHFAFSYGGVSVVALAAQYQLHSYFSDAVGFALLKQLGGGSLIDAILFGSNEILLGLVALALFVLAWWLGQRLLFARSGVASPPPQPSGWSTHLLLAALLAWLALLAVVPRTGSDAGPGLSRMLGWSAVQRLASQVTDFDRDGYGLFGHRIDRHPFDPARHPLALDVPGNGIDEDGYGGDLLPVSIPVPRPETRVPAGSANLVMVVMESTRADVIGKRIDGLPVAPNLERLAMMGAGITPSFSHVGFTTASLKSIFSGRLAPHAGDPSLFTELKASGYGVAVFSGQPEDFGDISETVGMRASADIFVDAELLKDKRAFSFAAQGSLLVDEQVLMAEFDRLMPRARWNSPQFVYLNFQSAHFPYDHPGVARRFARKPIARGDIAASRRAEVERTYWNAVAHADAQLGHLISRLETLGVWDNTVLIVTGDHGESLFEDGFLGHGHIINRRQFGTFLVVNRPLPGLNAPVAISDYRDIALGLLTRSWQPRPRHAPFMHIGDLDQPSSIGLADTPFGIVSLRLDTGETCFEVPAYCRNYACLRPAEKRVADSLVARWGSERWSLKRR